MPLLSWFNRDADLTRAALAPYRLLEPVAELSPVIGSDSFRLNL